MPYLLIDQALFKFTNRQWESYLKALSETPDDREATSPLAHHAKLACAHTLTHSTLLSNPMLVAKLSGKVPTTPSDRALFSESIVKPTRKAPA